MASSADLPKPPKKKADSTKRAAPTKRDPNEPISENWQRRLHLADKMDAPKAPLEFKDGTLHAENYTLSVGSHVYVASQDKIHADLLTNWDETLPAFRIGRIFEIRETDVSIHWLVRAGEVQAKASCDQAATKDSREVYLTRRYSEDIRIDQIRGECVVQHAQEMRTLAKFREKSSQFYFKKFYDFATRELYDVVPLTSLKVWLGPSKCEKLGLRAEYAVLSHDVAQKLRDLPKRTRAAVHTDDSEPTPSEQTLKEFAEEKTRCLVKFWNFDTKNWGEFPKPSVRVGTQFQCEVEDWPGAPLRYYTWSLSTPSNSARQPKLLEGDEVVDIDDKSKPWIQEMPSGYMPRGTETTSTPLSLPAQGLPEFISTCQKNYAPQLEIPAENLNFLDACCGAFTNTRGDAESALLVVSRLAKHTLIPDLTSDDVAKFVRHLDPFKSPNWHKVYRAMIHKPFQELCLFYFSRLPFRDHIKLTHNEDLTTGKFSCVECRTQQAPEWFNLPTSVFILPEEDLKNRKLALCNRCARLWYRYRAGWHPYSEVEQMDPQLIEPELIDDANSYKSEQDRRAKRRQSAVEKKEANEKRKLQDKDVKPAAKKPKKGDGDQNDKSKDEKKKKTKEPGAKETKKLAKAEEVTKTPKSKQTSADIETEDSEAGRVRGVKKRGTETQLSLDSVDEILASIDKDLEPDNVDASGYCPVCGQVDLSMPQLTCASCLLVVHSACYGSTLRDQSDDPWLCDCCLNSRRRLPEAHDMNYQCELCPPRSPDYVSWQAGVPGKTAPDVLKPTLNKRWCHIRCAIFNDKVTFAEPSKLSGISVPLSANRPHECKICQEKHQGSERPLIPTIYLTDLDQLKPITPAPTSAIPFCSIGDTVKCEFCDDYFHVSCAADSQFKLGFTADNSRAVIVCSKHGANYTQTLTSISKMDLALGMSALQWFASRYKVGSQSSRKERYDEQRTKLFERLSMGINTQQIVVGDRSVSLSRNKLRCQRCFRETSGYWHIKEDGAVVCAWCFRGYESVPDVDLNHLWSMFFARAGKFPKSTY